MIYESLRNMYHELYLHGVIDELREENEKLKEENEYLKRELTKKERRFQ